jgi:hypothetical protein
MPLDGMARFAPAADLLGRATGFVSRPRRGRRRLGGGDWSSSRRPAFRAALGNHADRLFGPFGFFRPGTFGFFRTFFGRFDSPASVRWPSVRGSAEHFDRLVFFHVLDAGLVFEFCDDARGVMRRVSLEGARVDEAEFAPVFGYLFVREGAGVRDPVFEDHYVAIEIWAGFRFFFPAFPGLDQAFGLFGPGRPLRQHS